MRVTQLFVDNLDSFAILYKYRAMNYLKRVGSLNFAHFAGRVVSRSRVVGART